MLKLLITKSGAKITLDQVCLAAIIMLSGTGFPHTTPADEAGGAASQVIHMGVFESVNQEQ